MREKIKIAELYLDSKDKKYWKRIRVKNFFTIQIPFITGLECKYYKENEKQPFYEDFNDRLRRDKDVKLTALTFIKFGKPKELKTRIIQKYILKESK